MAYHWLIFYSKKKSKNPIFVKSLLCTWLYRVLPLILIFSHECDFLFKEKSHEQDEEEEKVEEKDEQDEEEEKVEEEEYEQDEEEEKVEEEDEQKEEEEKVEDEDEEKEEEEEEEPWGEWC